MIHRLTTAALCALAALACKPNQAPASGGATPPAPVHADALGDSALRYPFLPDTERTPGRTLDVTAADICVPGYSRKVRNVPAAVKRAVYASYGITHREPGEYEVDHLISLELGGSNSVKNLWPQSYRTHPWNARVKDALENELHRRVCAGTLDLATAQRVIASNWVIGYRRYVRQTPPVPKPKPKPSRVP
jgi:hypothetical protein